MVGTMRSPGSRWTFLVGLLAALFSSAASARAVSPDARDFFEKRVRPVLVKHCYECHGPNARVRGGLRLDSRAALLRGGDRGAALQPGKPDESLLVQAVRHQGDVKMPPRTQLT